MALIPSKARGGIAALTFAAAVVPFVSATPAQATTILEFLEGEEGTLPEFRVNGTVTKPDVISPEFIQTSPFTTQVPPFEGTFGIRFVESATDSTTSDILQVTVLSAGLGGTITFSFFSDPVGFTPMGFTDVVETGETQPVGLPADPVTGRPDTLFRNAAGQVLGLPPDFQVFVRSDVEVPGPVVGAGLPGFLAACVGLLAWWRRRQKIA